MSNRQYFTAIAAMVVFVLCMVVFQAHLEASAFNRLTGKDATWWDAMCVQLRVTGDGP